MISVSVITGWHVFLPLLTARTSSIIVTVGGARQLLSIYIYKSRLLSIEEDPHVDSDV